MSQHFLLSAAARTVSLKAVFKMGEDKAYETFRKLRWPATDGEAVCPKCGCIDTYDIASRRQFECAACKHHFSVTSGTIFSIERGLEQPAMAGIEHLLLTVVTAYMAGNLGGAIQDAHGGGGGYQGERVAHRLRRDGVIVEVEAYVDGFAGTHGLHAVGVEGMKGERNQTRLLVTENLFHGAIILLGPAPLVGQTLQ